MPLRVAILGNPASHRIALFNAALERSGQPPALILSYLDLIAGRASLDQVLPNGGLLRIESPGQDFEVEKALIALGADEEDENGNATRISLAETKSLRFQRGRIWFPRQWFLGFRKVLEHIDQQIKADPEIVALNPSEDVATMFDKPRCHACLDASGIPCPEALGPVRTYEQLRHQMRAAGIDRVFVKLSHGSSASGVVALAVARRGIVATTTTERVHEGAEIRLYNSRKVRRMEDERDIADLLNALTREGVHVERWIPKASLNGETFDLRVVVIAGHAEHVVVRLGRGPITNLHLGNRRGDSAPVRGKMSPSDWRAAMATCEKTASVFPGSLHAGVDLLIAPGFRRHAVLEVNAFGDLLHGATVRGIDTYSAEVEALLRGRVA